MTTLQLEYFLHLSRTLHLTRTAEHFYVSPPAIAASIKRLENELSTTLFVSQGRALLLTESGKIFSRYAADMLRMLSAAKEEISEDKHKYANTLSIAIASPVLWSNLFREFMKRYPDIKINSSLATVAQLSNPDIVQGFDFVFCPSSDLTSSAFDSLPLPGNTNPCLVVYKSHPFANRSGISLIEAKDERFIALSRGYSFRKYFDTLCQLANFTPNIVLECDFQIRAAMLAAEYGILLTTKQVAELGVLGDVSYVDIVDPLFARTMLFSRNKYTKNKASAELFFNFVKQYYNLSNESYSPLSGSGT